MKLKYKGDSPLCLEIKNNSENFIGEYHPNCCRYPKSCSSGMYEFYPEDDVEVPGKLYIRRIKGIGPGTEFDWIVYGLHRKLNGTVTLFKYFGSFEDASEFARKPPQWQDLLKSEGLSIARTA